MDGVEDCIQLTDPHQSIISIISSIDIILTQARPMHKMLKPGYRKGGFSERNKAAKQKVASVSFMGIEKYFAMA